MRNKPENMACFLFAKKRGINMGERTQLFINIEDAKGDQILGTVVHYQWGYGTVMLESALDIATNMKVIGNDGYGKGAEQKSYESALFKLLKNNCGCKKPDLTYALRNSIDKNIGCSGELNVTTFEFEQAVQEPVHDFQKEPCDLISVVDPVLVVKRAYKAKYENFFNQCDNNDGLMFINMKTAESIENVNSSYWDASEIKFGFGLITGIMYPEWHPATFEQYARQDINRDDISDEFIENYKLLLKKYEIEMMSPDELYSRKQDVKQLIKE